MKKQIAICGLFLLAMGFIIPSASASMDTSLIYPPANCCVDSSGQVSYCDPNSPNEGCVAWNDGYAYDPNVIYPISGGYLIDPSTGLPFVQSGIKANNGNHLGQIKHALTSNSIKLH